MCRGSAPPEKRGLTCLCMGRGMVAGVGSEYENAFRTSASGVYADSYIPPVAGRSGPQAHLLRPLWRMEVKQAFTVLRHERVEIYQRTNSLRNSIGDATDCLTRTMRLTFWPQAGTTHLFEQPTNGLKRKDGRLARLAVDIK
jgi:hypothetical protein